MTDRHFCIRFINYHLLLFSALCTKNILCNYWQETEDGVDEEGNNLFTCLLLYHCKVKTMIEEGSGVESELKTNTDNTIVITSGERTCLPDVEKRRKCEPACCSNAPYCHGRCYKGGRACAFHPCSRSPYREDGGSSCSQFALEAGEEGGECHEQCAQVTNDMQADTCQECLGEKIHSQCQQMSGQSCWHCSLPIKKHLVECMKSPQDPVDTVGCIKNALIPRCQVCTCTLLCYWIPGGDLCKACLENAQLASLFVNSDHCPQGWTWVEAESKCLKAFAVKRPWPHASEACKTGGGRLATIRNISSIQAIIEASITIEEGELWLGGRYAAEGDKYIWEDGTSMIVDNWAPENPLTGTH